MSKTQNPPAFRCLKRCLKRQSHAFRRFKQRFRHRNAVANTAPCRFRQRRRGVPSPARGPASSGRSPGYSPPSCTLLLRRVRRKQVSPQPPVNLDDREGSESSIIGCLLGILFFYKVLTLLPCNFSTKKDLQVRV